MVAESIKKCDEDIQKYLLASVVLSGGSTMFTGIAERMTKELTGLMPPRMTVKVKVAESKDLAAWVGASILGSLSTTPWITKQEYDEHGTRVGDEQFRKAAPILEAAGIT